MFVAGGGGSGVFVGRGVLVTGRGVFVAGTRVLLAGREVFVPIRGPPALSVARIWLSFVGDRGITAFVAYWEEVIGISANSPLKVPHSFATQQFIEGLFTIRHQLLPLFLPITSTVSPDLRIVTTM